MDDLYNRDKDLEENKTFEDDPAQLNEVTSSDDTVLYEEESAGSAPRPAAENESNAFRPAEDNVSNTFRPAVENESSTFRTVEEKAEIAAEQVPDSKAQFSESGLEPDRWENTSDDRTLSEAGDVHGQSVGSTPDSPYVQSGQYGPGGAYGDSAGSTPDSPHAGSGQYSSGGAYGDRTDSTPDSPHAGSGQYSSGGAYGDRIDSTPESPYAGSGQYGSGGAYGDRTGSTSESPYAGSGQYSSGTGYGDPGMNTRNSADDMGSAMGNGSGNRPGRISGQNRPANGGSTGRNQSYSNNGYGKGRTGYSSSYDSYRFETPVDPAPINPRDTNYGARKKKTTGTVGNKNNNEPGKWTRFIAPVAAIAVLFGLISALVFMAVTSLFGGKVTASAKNEQKAITAIPTPSLDLGKSEKAPETEQDQIINSTGTPDTETETTILTVPQVVELCMPSMVSITNTTIEEYRDFFGGRTQQESVSAGSGIIVGETETELLIATNNHVIQNSKDITVTFIDNEAVNGSIKGMDADNDLAIVAVNLSDIRQETRDAIRIISIGDSDSVVVGESVVAIGNALGYGQSVSAGIVSAIGREVFIDGQNHSLIQTDASINPGNSGGALINMRGELIGINEVKYVDETVEGVGYAIPMATAEPILNSLGSKAARQKVSEDEASYIGIKCLDVPSYYVQAGYPSGVYVSEVTKGGPADNAGLKEGDIITAIDGISVKSSNQLVNYLQYYAAGEVIDFSVSRLNEDNTAFNSSKVPITLGRKKDAAALEESGQNETEGDTSAEAGVDENTESQPEESPEGESENGSGSEEAAPADEGTADEGTVDEAGPENGGFPFLPDVKTR